MLYVIKKDEAASHIRDISSVKNLTQTTQINIGSITNKLNDITIYNISKNIVSKTHL